MTETTYRTYHFAIWTGPTAVAEVAARLRETALVPGAGVTVVGTERIHFTIEATSRGAAELKARDWWTAAGVGCYAGAGDLRFLRVA